MTGSQKENLLDQMAARTKELMSEWNTYEADLSKKAGIGHNVIGSLTRKKSLPKGDYYHKLWSYGMSLGYNLSLTWYQCGIGPKYLSDYVDAEKLRIENADLQKELTDCYRRFVAATGSDSQNPERRKLEG